MREPTGQLDDGSLSASTGRLVVLAALNDLHQRHRSDHTGRLADYIPELTQVDPDTFAIAVYTCDGQFFGVGDFDVTFTMQSMANPFMYGMALEDLGREAVLERVGVEPSGNPYNSIVLDRRTNRPSNPMVNAGAIEVTSLILGDNPSHRLNRVLGMFSRYMGRRASVDMQVYASERAAGDRNRAIAHLMRNFGMLAGDLDESLDLYFQQCSVNITTRDLALMGACLANKGVNPLTGDRALDPRYLRDVLTIMLTCGMYEVSGRWTYDVGVPAKSGISGGLVAVVPGQMGIGVYSPLVDGSGNSVRGSRVLHDLSRMLSLHLLSPFEGEGV